jgi:hypothetical protein
MLASCLHLSVAAIRYREAARVTRTFSKLIHHPTGAGENFMRTDADSQPCVPSSKSRRNRTRECARDITRMIRRRRQQRMDKKKMGTTEQQERLKRERDEIAARVASFKATQEKFEREREEFFRRTWRTIRKA